jgi:Histidine kinase-, DNA gyrase B-, and HSP90-like ATPase
VNAMTGDFQNSNSISASSPSAQNLKFEREDWVLFRVIDGLTQKAGVSRDKLSRLVMKELADNSCDAGSSEVEVGKLGKSKFFVDDNGPGFSDTPEEIARLFSIHRPMISSKYLRLPTRGAVGNGLRVAAGAVLASGGSLVVITRNRRIELRPERSHHDGGQQRGGQASGRQQDRDRLRSGTGMRQRHSRLGQGCLQAGKDGRAGVSGQVVTVVVRRRAIP